MFVIGDLAAAQSREPGGSQRPVPGVSPAAKQMGRHAAHTLLARLRQARTGQAPSCAPSGTATMARWPPSAARPPSSTWAASSSPAGFAWLFWLFMHIYFLIGFRNRLVVLMDWAWAYLSFQRYARIVVGKDIKEPKGRN